MTKLGAEFNSDPTQEDVVYAILDKQAIDEGNKKSIRKQNGAEENCQKDTDRVYSVNGKKERTSIQENKVSTEQPAF